MKRQTSTNLLYKIWIEATILVYLILLGSFFCFFFKTGAYPFSYQKLTPFTTIFNSALSLILFSFVFLPYRSSLVLINFFFFMVWFFFLIFVTIPRLLQLYITLRLFVYILELYKHRDRRKIPTSLYILWTVWELISKTIYRKKQEYLNKINFFRYIRLLNSFRLIQSLTSSFSKFFFYITTLQSFVYSRSSIFKFGVLFYLLIIFIFKIFFLIFKILIFLNLQSDVFLYLDKVIMLGWNFITSPIQLVINFFLLGVGSKKKYGPLVKSTKI